MILTKPPPTPPKFHGAPKLVSPKVFDLPTRQVTPKYAVPLHDEQTPAWVHVLRTCGLPLKVVVIDFESYFDDEYRMARGSGEGLTTIEYVMDRRWETLSCAFTLMDGHSDPFGDYEANTFVRVGEEMVETQIRCLQRNYGENLDGLTVVFQNGNFDALVLSRRYGVHPKNVIDVLALSRHWHARSKHDLGTQADRYGLEEKGETEDFKGLTFRRRFVIPKSRKKGPKLPVQRPVITEEQKAKLVAYNRNDNLREWELFTILLPKLSNPTVELRLMQHTLELWTKPTLRCDFAKGEEIVAAMEAEIDKALAGVLVHETDGEQRVTRPVTRDEISGNNSYEHLLTEALKEAGDNPMDYMKPIKGGKFKFADSKTDNFRADLIDHRSPRVRQIMAARVAIKSWPLHIARVQRIMRMARADGGWLPVPLKYCGAHTGRWSGGEKINLQNLGSRGHELITAIRSMLVAPEGHSLVIVDAAQIEARGNDWISGQRDSCERWERGEDQYATFASAVVGYRVRKPKKTDPPPIAARMKRARDAIGKVGVLGCGYGMGAGKAQDYAVSLTGIAISFEEAEQLVKRYRETHPQVVQFWRDVERAFLYTAKYKRPSALARGLRFDAAADCDVVMTLPNGREIKYAKVRVGQDDRGEHASVWNATEHTWEHIWGGTITENIVQGFSRDALCEAFLRVEDRTGCRTGLHVHDEMVLVVPDERAEEVLAVAIEEMSRRPWWAPDFPLGAEGCISKVYKK